MNAIEQNSHLEPSRCWTSGIRGQVGENGPALSKPDTQRPQTRKVVLKVTVKVVKGMNRVPGKIVSGETCLSNVVTKASQEVTFKLTWE